MKGHFIDFIKEKWINILKFDFAYMFLQVLRYIKKILMNFLKTKWQRRISRKQIRFFFGGRTTTGRNFAPRTKIEKDSENIYKNEVSIIGFLYTFLESFLFFVLGAKLRPVVVRPPKKKNGFVCDRFCAAILCSKNVLNLFSCTLTLVETCMQNQISKYSFMFL